MTLDLDAFRSAFIDEAREHIVTLEQGLLQLEREPRRTDTLNTIFRAAHSIKGAAGTLGFSAIARYTHLLETILDALRNGTMPARPETISVLLRATDDLRRLVDAGLGSEQLAIDESAIRSLAESAASGVAHTDEHAADPAAVARQRRVRVTIVPSEEFFRTGLDPILVFRDLQNLGTLEGVVCDLSRVPRLVDLDPTSCHLAWTAVLHTDASDDVIRDVFLFVADACKVTIEADPMAPVERRKDRHSLVPLLHDAPVHESTTLRVGSNKVDAIIDLVGELVIAQSMVLQLLDTSALTKTPSLRDAMSQMTRNMQELQERVMGIRMVPVASLFGRFARVVRDTAANLHKSVALVVEGQDTEIDKAVIERLSDPITHLVRNALDHGLETDEERAALGKLEGAMIRLSAQHVAGGIVIEVADNGRGLDTARIREKALGLGLLTPNDPYTDEQIHALIFQPGFSTATTVTDLSGRGVGMDVVRRCVDSLNGTICVSTTPRVGTTFQIRLPLTLAILDGLLLRVEQQTYILPLLTVTESFRPSPDAVKEVTGSGSVAIVRGSALPLVDLGSEFGLCTAHRDPSRSLVVVVEADGRRIGLVVDSLIGQSQVVVKSIEAHYRRVDGVLGATILGDGTVAFIVDVAGLVRLAWSRRNRREPIKAA